MVVELGNFIDQNGNVDWKAFGEIMLTQLRALQPGTTRPKDIADDILVLEWMLSRPDARKVLKTFCYARPVDEPGHGPNYRVTTDKLGWDVPRG